jgi:hypothetical protein
MTGNRKNRANTLNITARVRARIEGGGARLWRMDDFADLRPTAVAKALSRLAQEGAIQRLSKGTYYRSEESSFGTTKPNPVAIRKLAQKTKMLFPAGNAAANLLGFTTQTGRQSEIATTARSVPRKLIGLEAVVHTRRPEAWASLSEFEAAILDFIRRGGRTSELQPKDTLRHLRELLSRPNVFANLLNVALGEPPRVRAILGAFGEAIGTDSKKLRGLRKSLNPYSRFDFGVFANIPNARDWQAKEALSREAVRA